MNADFLQTRGSDAYARIQQQQLLRDVSRVEALNRNPRAFSSSEIEEILLLAQQLGLSTSRASKLDKATAVENLGSGAVGALDALAFGLIPDHWYSSHRTNKAKNIGKVAGTIASLIIPGAAASGLGQAFKVGKNAAKAGKHAYGVLGGAKAAKGAKDYIALAKLVGGAGAKAGIAGARAMGSRGIKDTALALIRAMQLVDTTPRALYPSQNAQPSPYEMMQMMGTPLGEM